MRRDAGDGIIIEVSILGNVAKVSAIDTRSGTEASIVAPANQPESVLHTAAIRKLRYVLSKKKKPS